MTPHALGSTPGSPQPQGALGGLRGGADDASKQLRERKTWRELYHRRLFPLPRAFSKIVTPPFLPDSVFTLFREKGGNYLFRSSSRFNLSKKIQ